MNIAYGYVPESWRQARLKFIQKSCKSSFEDVKFSQPICLPSIFLKINERMIDWYIKKDCFNIFPLHNSQCAYQKGRSMKTILIVL